MDDLNHGDKDLMDCIYGKKYLQTLDYIDPDKIGIIGPNGCGKSTLLGVSAARLLRQGLARVTVVAPGRAAAATLYRHARMSAGMPADGGIPAELPIGSGRLCFRLPAEWRPSDGEASSLVLVDEAAAIPVAQLVRLLRSANRLVFASTVHGYEGSGRGFELRFRAALDRDMPQWRAMRLNEPVRWAVDDPLEDLMNRIDAGIIDDIELRNRRPAPSNR